MGHGILDFNKDFGLQIFPIPPSRHLSIPHVFNSNRTTRLSQEGGGAVHSFSYYYVQNLSKCHTPYNLSPSPLLSFKTQKNFPCSTLIGAIALI